MFALNNIRNDKIFTNFFCLIKYIFFLVSLACYVKKVFIFKGDHNHYVHADVFKKLKISRDVKI